ncbi:RidA family protein [Anaerotruncus colihominis]|uniref:RidA family protein n=1 Tax=Anaerotruncus colihominis TaxID=169435 RepID=UPI000467EB86|nr:RidA family protein [Anaerotruncus colihominis]UOX66693.1 RidA family protein [Anaerotruncus colihominis]
MKELVVSKDFFITDDFSQSYKVGNLLFVSGITARNKKGEIIETDFEAQTVRIFKNIELILKEAGATLDDIIKFTVYLKDMNNVKLFREIRNRFCSVPRPASTAIEVTGLVPGAIVEVEVVAECGGC